ncbi:MAG: cytidine deaminase [Leeuwenhoekiella sp.]
MKKIEIPASLYIFENTSELPEAVQGLMQRAAEARENAYAPYSNFQVGAALLLDNGKIIKGNNQENAAYPSGLCAERTALYYAGAKYPDAAIVAICVTASGKHKSSEIPIPPCGACRQAIAEYEVKQKSPVAIYFMGKQGKVMKSDSLENLLPVLFTQNLLGK